MLLTRSFTVQLCRKVRKRGAIGVQIEAKRLINSCKTIIGGWPDDWGESWSQLELNG